MPGWNPPADGYVGDVPVLTREEFDAIEFEAACTGDHESAAERMSELAVTGTQSERPQTGRDALCLVRVFCPGEPDVLVAADEGDAIGKSIRSFEKGLSYRLSDDDTLWTLGITPHRSSFPCLR